MDVVFGGPITGVFIVQNILGLELASSCVTGSHLTVFQQVVGKLLLQLLVPLNGSDRAATVPDATELN